MPKPKNDKKKNTQDKKKGSKSKKTKKDETQVVPDSKTETQADPSAKTEMKEEPSKTETMEDLSPKTETLPDLSTKTEEKEEPSANTETMEDLPPKTETEEEPSLKTETMEDLSAKTEMLKDSSSKTETMEDPSPKTEEKEDPSLKTETMEDLSKTETKEDLILKTETKAEPSKTEILEDLSPKTETKAETSKTEILEDLSPKTDTKAEPSKTETKAEPSKTEPLENLTPKTKALEDHSPLSCPKTDTQDDLSPKTETQGEPPLKTETIEDLTPKTEKEDLMPKTETQADLSLKTETLEDLSLKTETLEDHFPKTEILEDLSLKTETFEDLSSEIEIKENHFTKTEIQAEVAENPNERKRKKENESLQWETIESSIEKTWEEKLREEERKWREENDNNVEKISKLENKLLSIVQEKEKVEDELQRTNQRLKKEKDDHSDTRKSLSQHVAKLRESREDLKAVQESLMDEEDSHKATKERYATRLSEANSRQMEAFTLLAEAREEARLERLMKERESSMKTNERSKRQQIENKVIELEQQKEVLKSEREKLQTSLNSRSDYEYILFRAAHSGDLELTKFLISKGVSTNTRHNDGKTPLHVAASYGFTAIVTALIGAGANIESTDDYGNRPLHEAAKAGSEDVVKVLLKNRADIYAENSNGRTPVQLATSLGKTNLLPHLATDRSQPLVHMAAASGQKAACSWLLEKGFPTRTEDEGPAYKYAQVAGFFSLALRLCLLRRGILGKVTYYLFMWPPLSWIIFHFLSTREKTLEIEDVKALQVEEDKPEKLTHNHHDEGQQPKDELTIECEVSPVPKAQKKEAPSPVLPLPKFPRVGLPNIGNTCYMNAVIQCLYHTLPLTEFFSKEENRKRINRSSSQHGEAADAYFSMVEVMTKKSNLLHGVKVMKTMSGTYDNYLKDYGQKEPHDLLASLLEWLHTDLGKPKSDMEPNSLTSIISSTFHIKYLELIICEEHNYPIIVKVESSSNLTAALPTQGTAKLQDLLESHYREQYVDWFCDKCRRRHRCLRQTKILQLPPFLIIHLSRYNAANPHAGKAGIEFPQNLDFMNKFCTYKSERRYSVFGLCGHAGTMKSGHCFALCKPSGEAGEGDSREQWYHLNDQSVSQANDHKGMRPSDVHILFYKAV